MARPTRITYLRILFVLVIAAALTAWPLPSPAHVAPNPHVPDAWYKPSEHLVFDKDGVPNTWQFYDAMHNIDNRMGVGPDMHEGECEAHPNWGCIEVRGINNPDVDYIAWNPDPNWTPQHGLIRLNTGAGYPADISGSCRAIARILGLHPYTSGAGCMHEPWSLDADQLGETGMDALRDAYRRG